MKEQMEKLVKELEAANERLKELDKAKSEFVSIASHQLRTPVTAVKGYASMLLEGSFGAIPEKARVAVEKIFESSNRLVSMITDFLTLSRIERGKMEYNFQKVNFKELVSNIMDEFKAINIREKKGLDLSLEIAEEKDWTLTLDPDKIRQVVYNILENAMKYTQKGFIKTSLCKNPDKSRVILKVRDSGIGISKESLGKIFQKFTQASEHTDINISGLGLGLYVSQEIIKAHQGRIWAESGGEGKGSAFSIELPC
jgi:signal transduction histidine kinase